MASNIDLADSFFEQSNSAADSNSQPRKLRRISRACDFCHKRSIRCRPSGRTPLQCQNCLDFGLNCTYKRPTMRRGAKAAGKTKASPPDTSEAPRLSFGDSEAPRPSIGNSGEKQSKHGQNELLQIGNSSSSLAWQARARSLGSTIEDLVEIYFEVVYPIFPLFHRPTLRRRIAQNEHHTNQAFNSSVMAICGLAFERARDGALLSGPDPSRFPDKPPKDYCALAKDLVPKDFRAARGIDYMRTCAILALIGIQRGEIQDMQYYLGTFHTLVGINRLYDETYWPESIGIVELEERRRLFWSMYTLEIYSSTVWGGVIRCREVHSNVRYPCEIDDDYFSDAGYQFPPLLSSANPVGDSRAMLGSANLPVSWLHDSDSPPSSQVIESESTSPALNWLHGWNFTTDMYRILEHVTDLYRHKHPDKLSSVTDFARRDKLPKSIFIDKVMEMYGQLPHRFKTIPWVVRNPTEDRINFQAANIAATLQLVRMVIFSTSDSSVEEKCQIASELLAGFAKVPVQYLRAISSPLLHHLAGIGSLLSSVIERPLSEPSYLQVRTVLLAMANLLSGLELGLSHIPDASKRLRSLVAGIDEFMQAQRQAQRQVQRQNEVIDAQPSFVSSNPRLGLEDYQPSDSYGLNTESLLDDSMQFELPQELLAEWPWSSEFDQFSM